MKNDYLSYMRATEEYKNSDSLQHWRTKGSKNGISTTPGYKAIGEKAKGILNAAGQYIYDAGKSVGNAVSSVAKKVSGNTTSAAKTVSTQRSMTGNTTGSIARAKEAAAAKDKQISSERRETGSITRAKEKAAYENNLRNQDMNSFVAKFKGQAKASAETARREDKMNDIDARDNVAGKAAQYKKAIENAGSDLMDQAAAVINTSVKEDPEIENKVEQAATKAYKKYGINRQDFQDYGMTEANRKNLVRELVKCSSASEVLAAYERLCDKMAKEALYKKNQQEPKTVDSEYERESDYNSKKNKY